MPRRGVYGMWLLAGAVATLALAACSGATEETAVVSEPLAGPETQAAPPGSAAPAPAREPSAAAAVKVNGARRAAVSPGVPLVIAAVVRQSATAPARVPQALPPAPVIRADDGAPTTATLTFLGTDADSLIPGGALTLRWALQTPLPPGNYTVEWSPDGLFSTAIPVPRVRAATLRVLDAPTDAAELFFAQLRMLQAQGNVDEILQRVDTRLATDPDDLLALRVRAEALEQLSDPEQAGSAWMQLLARLSERAEAEAPGSEPEMAFWINARLADLSARSPRAGQ